MGKTVKPPRLELAATGVWYIAFNNGRRSDRQSTGCRSLSEAESFFAGWLRERERFGDDRLDGSGIRTVLQVVEIYEAQHIAPECADDTKASWPAVKRHILDHFGGDRRISDLTSDDFRGYAAAKRRTGQATGTTRTALSMFRAAMNFAARKAEPRSSRLPLAVVPWVPLPDPSPPRSRVLTVDECHRIRDAITPQAGPVPPLAVYFWLLWETGARKSAVETLTWPQVDFAAGLIRFNPFGRNQTSKRRPIVPMGADLRTILERAAEARGTDLRVCAGLTDGARTLGRFCARLGVKDVTPHVFRHTWATEAVSSGVGLEAVASMLGDTIKTVYDNYAHLQPEYLRAELGKMSRRR